MSQSTQSPLGRFVLFCVCLALAGGILAGAHYLAIDKPHQDALRPPTNEEFDPVCYAVLIQDYNVCRSKCKDSRGEWENTCFFECRAAADCTMVKCDYAIKGTPDSLEHVQNVC